MEIVAPLLLAAALIHATVEWSRRRKGTMDAVREQATRRLYREAANEEALEAELAPADVPSGAGTVTEETAPSAPGPHAGRGDDESRRAARHRSGAETGTS
ncbi:MAG: hypothetical protein WBW74_19150 [Xanthobacteraceae bacterium]